VNGTRYIAAAWFTFIWLILAGLFYAFTNMGDCPQGMTCEEIRHLDAIILAVGGFVWLGGIAWIVRRRKKL
jgi:hypothetical protein